MKSKFDFVFSCRGRRHSTAEDAEARSRLWLRVRQHCVPLKGIAVVISTVAPLLAGLLSPLSANACLQNRGYGPEVRSFLSFVKQEEEELAFQIQRGEISRKAYVRAKNRFAILRQAVLDRVSKTREDRVPEFNVVTAQEVDSLLPDGMGSLRGAKAGQKIGEKWRYVGSVTRGERFYILERLSQD